MTFFKASVDRKRYLFPSLDTNVSGEECLFVLWLNWSFVHMQYISSFVLFLTNREEHSIFMDWNHILKCKNYEAKENMNDEHKWCSYCFDNKSSSQSSKFLKFVSPFILICQMPLHNSIKLCSEMWKSNIQPKPIQIRVRKHSSQNKGKVSSKLSICSVYPVNSTWPRWNLLMFGEKWNPSLCGCTSPSVHTGAAKTNNNLLLGHTIYSPYNTNNNTPPPWSEAVKKYIL